MRAAPDGIVLRKKNLTNHPGDWYLELVLVLLKHNALTPWVVWKYNTETGGYFDGKYCRTFREAEGVFNDHKPVTSSYDLGDIGLVWD